MFGREPRAGTVKRRLATSVGSDPAARLYAALLDHTVSVAVASGFPVRLSLASAPVDAISCATPWEVQPPGDLGVRLHAAFGDAFARGAIRVVVVGSDCPEISVAHLRDASEALRDADVVLGPAEDGGYWLIGQRAPGHDLFSGVPWSTDATYSVTRERVEQRGLSLVELEDLVDVDTIDDLRVVARRGRVPPDLEAAIRRLADGHRDG